MTIFLFFLYFSYSGPYFYVVLTFYSKKNTTDWAAFYAVRAGFAGMLTRPYLRDRDPRPRPEICMDMIVKYKHDMGNTKIE